MELYLIRHPRPAVAPGVCYGRTDLGLAECPLAVAARLRPLLPADFVLYSSPLIRARLLAEALGTPLIDARLQEIDFGAWEGLHFDAIGPAIDAWAAEPLDFRPPGGESPREMAVRAHAFLADLRRAAPPAAVVVAHGGPLRALAGHLLGIDPSNWLGLDFACGEASRLDLHPWGTTLRWFNRAG
jgi:alpha-ribazole phosphatase